MIPTRSQCSYRWRDGNEEAELSNPIFTSLPLPDSLSKAVPKRRLHFLAGRLCAKEALARNGCADLPSEIKAGKLGCPIWPEGFVGSITHTEGFASAVVVPSKHLRGIGIDTETRFSSARASKIFEQIMSARELEAFFVACPDWPLAAVVTLCFSAKESAYKCLSPLVGRSFGFLDLEITAVDPNQESFCIRADDVLRVSNFELKGSYQFENDFVHTRVELD